MRREGERVWSFGVLENDGRRRRRPECSNAREEEAEPKYIHTHLSRDYSAESRSEISSSRSAAAAARTHERAARCCSAPIFGS